MTTFLFLCIIIVVFHELTTNQNGANTKEWRSDMTEENKRLFKEAIAEGWSNKIDKRITEYEEDVEVSKEHKIAMNRIFREYGCTELPFSEIEEK